MSATGKSAEKMEKAAAKAAFDAEGLASAKADVGGQTQFYRTTIEIQPPGLLQNSADGLLGHLDKKTKRGGEKADFDWHTAAYIRNGVIVHPAWHIRSALVYSAKEYQIPGRGKKSYHNAARSAIFVSPEFIPLRNSGGLAIMEPTRIDERPSKTATDQTKPARRPLYEAGHRLSFVVHALFDHVPGEVIRELCIYAGRFMGIGDYRPEFGRFEVVEFEKIDARMGRLTLVEEIEKEILKIGYASLG